MHAHAPACIRGGTHAYIWRRLLRVWPCLEQPVCGDGANRPSVRVLREEVASCGGRRNEAASGARHQTFNQGRMCATCLDCGLRGRCRGVPHHLAVSSFFSMVASGEGAPSSDMELPKLISRRAAGVRCIHLTCLCSCRSTDRGANCRVQGGFLPVRQGIAVF